MSEINWKNKCFVTTIYLVRDDRKVLLSWNKNMNTWIPVGGHLEQGETPEEAIIREVKEETGFDFEFLDKAEENEDKTIRIIKPLKIQIEKVPHHNYHINFVFIGKCTNWHERTENDDNEKLKWFSEQELINNKKDFLDSVWDVAVLSINKARNKA